MYMYYVVHHYFQVGSQFREVLGKMLGLNIFKEVPTNSTTSSNATLNRYRVVKKGFIKTL